MSKDTADRRAAPAVAERPPPCRDWRKRRPAAQRLDLSPEERAKREEAEKKVLRVEALHVQLTPEEKAELKRRAKLSGKRLSDFARAILLSAEKEPAPPARDPEVLRALSFQLSKIGTNLNQLARIANENRDLPHEAALRGVAAQIVAALEKVVAL